LAAAVAPFAAAFSLTNAQASRISTSPPRTVADTIRVAPPSADHANASGRDSTVRDVGDSVVIVASRVSSRLAGFEARRRRGIGRFITDSLLRGEESRPLAMVLRTYLPGFGRILDTRPNDVSPMERCRLSVFLNGLPTIESLAGISPHELAGVEFYTPSLVPQEYHRPGEACPVLGLWSRA